MIFFTAYALVQRLQDAVKPLEPSVMVLRSSIRADHSTSVTELMTLKASIKPVSLTVFWACGDMFIR